MSPFATLAAQAFATGCLVLLLFRLRPIFGLVPLHVCLGVFQVLQTLTATVVVEFGPDLLISPGSAVLFPVSLCALLLVYVREDLLEARKLIYALVIANLATGTLSLSIAYQLRTGSARSLLNVPADLFSQAASVLVIGTTVLFVDAVLIPVPFELLAHRLRGFFLRASATLVLVLGFDSLLFVSLVFGSAPNYGSLLASALVGKSVFAVAFCGLVTFYLWRFEREPGRVLPGTKSRDMFAILTYREKYERLKVTASRDGLTGVFNRGHFDEALEQEWQRGRRSSAPLSLILVDADYFKALNDRYGHPEGDRCLKALAGALRDHLKRPSDIVARYGGEEFAVLLPGTDAAGARVIAEKLRAAVAGLNILHEDHPLGHVTVSLGVATLNPETPLRTVDLMARADAALYRAKAGGRNRVAAADP